LSEVSIEVVYSADPPLGDATFRVVVPMVEGYVALTVAAKSGVTTAALDHAERLE
jgi:fructose-specific phosphotransferase system IIC component